MSADLQNLDTEPALELQASAITPEIVSKSEIDFKITDNLHLLTPPERLKIPAPDFFDCGAMEIDVLRFTSRSGTQHDVFYLDSPSTEVVIRHPHFIVVNRHHALLGDGDTPLEAAVLGELAYSWLEQHGIPYDNRRRISLRDIESRDIAPEAAGMRSIGLLRAIGEASAAQLHELYSACWSTRQSPRFEQTRRLDRVFATDSRRLACRRLGISAPDDGRTLADEVFMKTVEQSLAKSDSAHLPRAIVNELALAQRELLELKKNRGSSPDEVAAADAKLTSMFRRAIAKVQEVLGENGLAELREAYAALQWSLELLFSRQPHSIVPAPRRIELVAEARR